MFYRGAGPNPVHIKVYNVQGWVVRHIPDDALSPGVDTSYWDGKDDLGKTVSSGLYLVVFQNSGKKVIRKVIAN